jgi:hypothetical protein
MPAGWSKGKAGMGLHRRCGEYLAAHSKELMLFDIKRLGFYGDVRILRDQAD